MAAANGITSIIQTGVWFRSSNYYALFAFIANGHRHFVKLRLISCPAWLLVNGRELRLKTLSNGRFSPIPLDRKKEKDGRSENRGLKVGTTSFKDAFLIVPLYWPTFCLSGTGVGVCREDHVGKSRGYGTSIVKRDRKADDLGTGIADRDGGADDPGTSTPDKHKGAHNPGTVIGTADVDADQRVDNPSISTISGPNSADRCRQKSRRVRYRNRAINSNRMQ